MIICDEITNNKKIWILFSIKKMITPYKYLSKRSGRYEYGQKSWWNSCGESEQILTPSFGLTHGIKGMFPLFPTGWRKVWTGCETISCDALHQARALVLQGALLLTETAAGRKGESLRRSQAISLRIIIQAMLGSNSMKARINQSTNTCQKKKIKQGFMPTIAHSSAGLLIYPFLIC